jgi:peptide/nickel transport system ATP-binding protein
VCLGVVASGAPLAATFWGKVSSNVQEGEADGVRVGGRSALLVVRGLEVTYGRSAHAIKAVWDVSFAVARGEFVGIAGESGCGKSTLAFALSRLLRGSGRITAGEVLWFGDGEPGVDLVSADAATLRRIRWAGISVVMQSAMNAMNPVLTVRSQIDDVMRAHEPSLSRRERDERVGALLKMVRIPLDRARAYPHELSGGMRQRAMIALAVALSPRLVILDEPTTALDVVMQRVILDEIRELQEALGFSVIFITHDLPLLVEAADRILVMYAGTIVENAAARELYDSPMHPYSRGLIGSSPKVTGDPVELTGIRGSPPSLHDLPPGCPFGPRCSWVMEACSVEVPRLVARRSGSVSSPRETACHLYPVALDSVRAAGS